MEREFVATDAKAALIEALSACGYARIKITSFVSPKAIPMLRDADEVMGRIQRVSVVEYTVLVPNLRGDHAQRFADAGGRGLTVCDTTGMAHPAQVQCMAGDLQQRFAQLQLTMHCHNTRGMGLANVRAAAQSGLTRFDGSLGGRGGCRYAPAASCNVCREDAIHRLDGMGYITGMNVDKLLGLAGQLPQRVGHAVPGQVVKAGRISQLYPAPAPVADVVTPAPSRGRRKSSFISSTRQSNRHTAALHRRLTCL